MLKSASIETKMLSTLGLKPRMKLALSNVFFTYDLFQGSVRDWSNTKRCSALDLNPEQVCSGCQLLFSNQDATSIRLR